MSFRLLVLSLATFILVPANDAAEDWPAWRGPNRNGVADPGQDPPLTFGGSENMKWAVDIPGRSHGSACVYGDRVYYASADEAVQVQALNALDRATGRPVWRTTIHIGGFTQKSNKKASWASGTPACDGEHVYISFVNGDAVYTTAVSASDGNQVWQQEITDYKIHQGYGSSPTLWEHLVIVAADNKRGGALCAMDRKTGEIAWKVERAQLPNYPSPAILEAGGKVQLFMTGTDRVSSFDPLTGKLNWEIKGATTECVSTTVTDGTHIFSSGGYPRNHVAAITADGSGKIAWETKDRVYVPSMIISDGYLYAAMDSGVAVCWNSATGEEMWKGRLGGTFSGSGTLVGDRIYAANESGECLVFRADPESLEIIAKNKLGDEIFATPSICGGEIFLRVAFYDGEARREQMICYAR